MKKISENKITLVSLLFLAMPLVFALYNKEFSFTIFKIYAVGIVLGAIILSIWTDILKDVYITTANHSESKTYSFSKVQGMWWTVIIGFCYVWKYGEEGVNEIVNLNSTCLVLLGIGVGTTLIGSLIDNTDLASGKSRYQDEIKSNGFFWDILCDGKTITVHRFQALIFNVVFGLVFIIKFFNDNYNFPDFENTTLGLLGISTSTYLTMKATSENNNNSPKVQTAIDTQKEAISNANDAANELLNSLK